MWLGKGLHLASLATAAEVEATQASMGPTAPNRLVTKPAPTWSLNQGPGDHLALLRPAKQQQQGQSPGGYHGGLAGCGGLIVLLTAW